MGESTRQATIVIPAWNEAETIGRVVAEFRAADPTRAVVVVDNASTDDTASIAAAAGARVVHEAQQGYGRAITAGLDAADTPVLVVAEADGTFDPADVARLIDALADADLAMGTRTDPSRVEPGAAMGVASRVANRTLGRSLGPLWRSSARLSDVGCTMRALDQTTWTALRPHLREAGPGFSVEMMSTALALDLRVVERPVTYRARAGGVSKHGADLAGLAKTALAMVRVIVRVRREGVT